MFKVEPTLTYSSNNGIFIRSYVEFIIECYDENKDVLYERYLTPDYIEKNDWYKGVVDFKLSTNNIGSNGKDIMIRPDVSFLVMSGFTLPEDVYDKTFGRIHR